MELDVNTDHVRPHLAVLDIALKQEPYRLYRAMSDAFFDERREAAWSRAGRRSASTSCGRATGSR